MTQSDTSSPSEAIFNNRAVWRISLMSRILSSALWWAVQVWRLARRQQSPRLPDDAQVERSPSNSRRVTVGMILLYRSKKNCGHIQIFALIVHLAVMQPSDVISFSTASPTYTLPSARELIPTKISFFVKLNEQLNTWRMRYFFAVNNEQKTLFCICLHLSDLLKHTHKRY